MNKQTNKIALLLVLYRDIEHLRRLVESLDKQTIDYEIFAVDCDKEQKSILYLKAILPNAHYFDYQGNLGYATGNNFLARKAMELGFEYLMICNTDVILGNNSLDNLYDILEKSDYLLVGPLIYSGTPENTLGIHSYAERMDFRKMAVCVDYGSDYEVSLLPNLIEVNIVTGCAFMIKSPLVNKYGLFYTEGFMYGEETDLACRMQKFGIKAICCKKAIVWHNHSNEKRSINSLYRSYYYMNRNFILLCKRYNKVSVSRKYIIKEMLLFPRKFVWCIRKYNVQLLYYYYKGFFDGCRSIKGKVQFKFDDNEN